MSNMIIQNYTADIISQRKAAASSNDPSIAALKVGAKPLQPKGRLIPSNMWESTKYAVKKPFQEAKFFVDAAQGKGNDYSIGRINDLGLKLGSLGIAAILAASASSPFKKGMEFVGFATWFGSMALWPKLVGSAVKLTKGFDPNQKYEDSYGRVKPFFQDPQYICWELYDNDKLNEVGDKLGIPTNIENREGAIRSKMQQIATQSNTWTMLTAGFATPILSSLLADQLGSRVFDPAVEKFMIAKARRGFEKEPSLNKDFLSDIDVTLKNTPYITEGAKDNLIKKISSSMLGTKLDDEVGKELDHLFDGASDRIKITKDLYGKVDNLLGVTANSETKKMLREFIKGQLADGTEAFLTKKEFSRFLKKVVIKSTPVKDIDKSVLLKTVANGVFTDSREIEIPEHLYDDFRNLYKVSGTYYDRKKHLLKFLSATLNDVDGSATANNWKKASSPLVKALGFSNDELQILANQKTPAKAADDIVTRRLKKIVSSPEQSAEAIKGIVKFYSASTAKDMKLAQEAMRYIDGMEELTLKQLRQLEQLSGKRFGTLESGFIRSLNSDRTLVANKVFNTHLSFSRPITAMNILSKISDGTDPDIMNLVKEVYSPVDLADKQKVSNVSRMLKDIVFNNEDASSFFNKFEQYDLLKPKDKEGLSRLMDVLFAPLKPEIRQHLSAEVADQIDDSNLIMKVLYSSLENPIKPELNMTSFDELKKVKNVKLLEMAKDYIGLEFRNDSDDTIKKFWQYLSDNGKFKDFFVLLKQEASDVGELEKHSDKFVDFFKKNATRLWWQTGQKVEGNTEMVKELTQVVNSSMSGFKRFTINDATMSAGLGLVDFVKKAASDTVSYKIWLKRAGMAAAVLTGVTAIGIALMGRKNKFNTDVYEYKREGVNNNAK